ncbi:MAG: hypothetical protein AABP62_14895 [Planctomycetota bacterium]
MQLFIDPTGGTKCLYGEEIPLRELGELTIRRASHVEPDEAGRWWADLAPCLGPRLGPFETRSAALMAEEHWLTTHVLTDGLTAS